MKGKLTEVGRKWISSLKLNYQNEVEQAKKEEKEKKKPKSKAYAVLDYNNTYFERDAAVSFYHMDVLKYLQSLKENSLNVSLVHMSAPYGITKENWDSDEPAAVEWHRRVAVQLQVTYPSSSTSVIFFCFFCSVSSMATSRSSCGARIQPSVELVTYLARFFRHRRSLYFGTSLKIHGLQ